MPLLHTVLGPFKGFMEQQSGLSGEVVMGGDPLALAQKLRDSEVQLGVFHGHEFAWAQMKYPKLQALVVCVNKTRDCKVHFVVRTDCPAKTVADMRGKVAALPRLNKAYCRLFFERRCVPAGTTPEKFYSRVQTPFDIDDGLDQVVTRKATCAVVDAVSLEEYGKANPARAKTLRTLLESEPFPGGILGCYEGKLNAATAQRLQAGLIAARDNPQGQKALRALRVTGFEAPSDEQAVSLTEIVKLYPPSK